MSVFLTVDGLVALFTLTALEIVLGIDNVVFISIISARLPLAQQALARKLGLGLALVTRLLLLFTISWMMGLTRPLFRAPFAGEVSGRDLILLVGGLFLIAKATWEIHGKLEGEAEEHRTKQVAASLASVIAQIMVMIL